MCSGEKPLHYFQTDNSLGFESRGSAPMLSTTRAEDALIESGGIFALQDVVSMLPSPRSLPIMFGLSRNASAARRKSNERHERRPPCRRTRPPRLSSTSVVCGGRRVSGRSARWRPVAGNATCVVHATAPRWTVRCPSPPRLSPIPIPIPKPIPKPIGGLPRSCAPTTGRV